MDNIKCMEGYELHEKLILFLTRADKTEEIEVFIQEILDNPRLNWDMFLGVVLNNRVSGIVYKRLRKYNAVPKYVIFYLKIIFEAQSKIVKQHIEEIQNVNKALMRSNVHFAFLKGSYMNTFVYDLGERISNDTDVMVWPEDLSECGKVLETLGYIQGEVKNGEIVPASRADILFAKMNTYEIIPYIKKMNSEDFPFHVVDINFKLSNDEKKGVSNRIINKIQDIDNGQYSLRIMTDENFLLYLCIHLYREATMVLKIMSCSDMTLYKFMDVHHFIVNKMNSLNWEKMYEESIALNRLNEVYYTLYFTEELYPGTIDKDILLKFKPENTEFLDEYKGRDNTDEVYKWNLGFKERVLNCNRKIEALSNVEKEYKRFKEIKEKLV